MRSRTRIRRAVTSHPGRETETRPPLQCLVERDTLREALAALTPEESVSLLLLLEGCTERQVAALLGLTTKEVYDQIESARVHMISACPELRVTLEGRVRRPSRVRRTHVLERGWLCPWPDSSPRAMKKRRP